MIRRFFSQCALGLKESYGEFDFWEFALFTFGMPLVGLISTCVFAGYGFNTSDLRRWVVGAVVASNSYGLIFTLGHSFIRDRRSGMFRSIIASKSGVAEVMAARVFYDIIIQIALMFVIFFSGCLIFAVDLRALDFGLFTAVLAVSVLSASALGVFIGAFGLISDQMHFIANLTASAVSLYCGAAFPVSQMPGVLAEMCMRLPVTRSILAANALFEGAGTAEIAPLVLGELVIGLVLTALACIVVKAAKSAAIKRGSFDIF